MLGRQCLKAIWLDQNQPDLKDPPTESDKLRFAQGNDVDKRAQTFYPQGIEVATVDWMLARNYTQKLIQEGQNRIYQAAFEYNNLRIRTDVLDLNSDGSCVLREVKTSTKIRDEHILDLAIQIYVLEATGVSISKAYLVVVNKDYVAGTDIPPFIEQEVTKEAYAVSKDVEPNLAAFNNVLAQKEMPAVDIGSHCKKPWPCPFINHCWQHIPDDSIYTIPRLSEKKKQLLKTRGILRVVDVPSDFELTDLQSKYVQIQKSGSDHTDKRAIRQILDKLPTPLYFLDFETFSTPLPVWPGTAPNQQIPFQYSCHKMAEDGSLSHHAYLHTNFDDPRSSVTESLLRWIGNEGSIMVYNNAFERKVLQALAAHQPAHADRLHGMIDRLFDQLILVKNHVAHPGLLGSNTLKRVSEVLLKGTINFDALEIKEGGTAQASWYAMVQMPEAERSSIAEALLAYCRHDTLAQVALHEWFLKD